MAQINEHYLKLQAGYLFPEIIRRTNEYIAENPEKKIIKMGIGDVTLPLTPSVIKAFHQGVNEMANASTFKGYGPYPGYDFLRKAIAKHEYQDHNVDIDFEEIFISDGSKCDTGNIPEIFGMDNKIAITDPVYPVYVDTTVMAGRTGTVLNNGYFEGIVYLPCTEANNFVPEIPKEKVDIIYLCYPNNPTGAATSREELTNWVTYARTHKSIILYDAAYESFITEKDIPHSIFEIKGADEVAVEFRSFSKKAGFTGTRCAYTVVPKKLMGDTSSGKASSIHTLWYRRQSTKFNGASYPVQVAAASVYSDQGKKETDELKKYYMENARIMREGLTQKGFTVYGGINAPYVWVKSKNNMNSWDMFDAFLHEIQIIGTPGSGFGPSGEGFFRFSSFADRKEVLEAMERVKNSGL